MRRDFLIIILKHISRSFFSKNHPKPKKDKIGNNLIFWFASALIAVLSFFEIIYRILFALFLFLNPAFGFIGKIFIKLFANIYRLLRFFLKIIGWEKRSIGFAKFARNRAVHLSVLILALVIIFSNIAGASSSTDFSANIGDPILTRIVKSEFGDMPQEEIVEEGFTGKPVKFPRSYLADSSFLNESDYLNGDLGDLPNRRIIAAYDQESPFETDDDYTGTQVTNRTETVYYVVGTGDTISTIAEKFGVSVNTILWENNLNATSMIRPGDKLAILPMSGVRHQVAKGETLGAIANKYGVEVETIVAANNIASNYIFVGQKLIIPGGKRSQYVPTQSRPSSGLAVITDIIRQPSATPAPKNKMNWPTTSYRITQYFSWKHAGLDIGNKVGQAIYAADAGTVIKAGWATGYGNCVYIDHGGGRVTRYGHASKLYVKNGQKVAKGEVIAAIGSTGWSTGPHLHFEVRINGVVQNPLSYIR